MIEVPEQGFPRARLQQLINDLLVPHVRGRKEALRTLTEHTDRVAIGSYKVGVTNDGKLYEVTGVKETEALTNYVGCPVEQSGLWDPVKNPLTGESIWRFDEAVLDACGLPRTREDRFRERKISARTVVVLNL